MTTARIVVAVGLATGALVFGAPIAHAQEAARTPEQCVSAFLARAEAEQAALDALLGRDPVFRGADDALREARLVEAQAQRAVSAFRAVALCAVPDASLYAHARAARVYEQQLGFLSRLARAYRELAGSPTWECGAVVEYVLAFRAGLRAASTDAVANVVRQRVASYPSTLLAACLPPAGVPPLTEAELASAR